MNYVDIAIIAIIALFALIGLWKGFGKTSIKLICFALALVVTWLLADTAVNWILEREFLRKFITGDGKISLYTLYVNRIGEVSAETSFGGVLGLYINPMISRFTEMGGPEKFNLTYTQFVGINLAVNTVSIVVCLIVYAVVRLVASLVSFILRKIILRGGKVRVWSRLVGFVAGAARGVALVAVLLVVSTIIYPIGFAEPYTNTVGEGMVSKFAAEKVYQGFDWAIYSGDKTKKLLESAGFKEYTLDDHKAEASLELDEYRATKDDSLYAAKQVEELDACVTAGKAAIEAAESVQGVSDALEQAKSALDSVLTSAQITEITNYVTEKSSALEQLKNDKIGTEEWTEGHAYSEENYKKISDAYTTALSEFIGPKSMEAVDAAYEKAVAAINAVPTIKQQGALDDLKTTFDSYDSAAYSEAMYAKIEAAYAEGNAAVMAAADDALDDPVTLAKAKMSVVPTTAKQVELVGALDTFMTDNTYTETELAGKWAAVKAAYDETVANINAADTVENAEKALEDGKTAITTAASASETGGEDPDPNEEPAP